MEHNLCLLLKPASCNALKHKCFHMHAPKQLLTLDDKVTLEYGEGNTELCCMRLTEAGVLGVSFNFDGDSTCKQNG